MFPSILQVTNEESCASKNLLLLKTLQKNLRKHTYKKTQGSIFGGQAKPHMHFNFLTVLHLGFNNFKTSAFLSRSMHSSLEIYLSSKY